MAKKTAATGNGFDSTVATSYVKQLEAEHQKLETERGKYMKRCRSIRDDIGSLMDDAKNKGIPKKILKDAVKHRAMRRKLESIREDMEPEQQDQFDLFQFAIGDLDEVPEREPAAGLPTGEDEGATLQ